MPEVCFHCTSQDMWEVIQLLLVTNKRRRLSTKYDEKSSCCLFVYDRGYTYSGLRHASECGATPIETGVWQKVLDNMTRDEIESFKDKLKEKTNEN